MRYAKRASEYPLHCLQPVATNVVLWRARQSVIKQKDRHTSARAPLPKALADRAAARSSLRSAGALRSIKPWHYSGFLHSSVPARSASRAAESCRQHLKTQHRSAVCFSQLRSTSHTRPTHQLRTRTSAAPMLAAPTARALAHLRSQVAFRARAPLRHCSSARQTCAYHRVASVQPAPWAPHHSRAGSRPPSPCRQRRFWCGTMPAIAG